ncbi:MAG: hypothetical protein NTX25_09535, partial [Proteobacteria bacterium]|nr:hypothetical protein [Pseudomonadota bacterium]
MNSTARHSLLAFGLVFSLAACGPKLQNVADSQGSRQAEPEASRRETVSVGVSVSQLGAGFQLASATSFSMSLTGCASGLSLPTITQANPNVSVYKFDQGCLIKLNSFVL